MQKQFEIFYDLKNVNSLQKPLLAKNLIRHNLRNLKISALRLRFDLPRFDCKKQIMAPVLPFEQQNFYDGRITRASSNGKAGIEVG